MSELTDPDASAPSGHDSTQGFRPTAVAAVPLAAIGAAIGVAVPGASGSVQVTGISLNSRSVRPGDLFVAVRGSERAMKITGEEDFARAEAMFTLSE